MSQPLYALSLFFHIGATVVWIGGIFITVLVVWPEMKRVLNETPSLFRLLQRLRKRFYPISNIALVILIVTGLFQMTADPNYEGFLQFGNQWSQVMLVKHLTIIVMVIVGLLVQFVVTPNLERIATMLEHERGNIADWEKLRRREVLLTWVNVLLAVIILACSVWAASL